MPTDSVTYTETDEAAAYLERYAPEHLRKLAMEQAEENASDAEHVAKVNEIIRRRADGERSPVDSDELRRKLLP